MFNHGLCEYTRPMKGRMISVKFEKQLSAIKNFFVKVGKRNLVIALAVVLVGVAVCLNIIFFSNQNKGYDGYEQSAGMTDETGEQQVVDNSSSYFSATQVSRQRARDEAIEVLQQVVSNSESDDAAKTQALKDINTLALQMEKESNIESLIVAKGFEQCVAVINGENVNIIVKATALTPAQLAQINEIVYEQTGIDPVNIKIIEK